MLQSRSSVLIRWKYDIVGGVDGKKKIIRIANCDEKTVSGGNEERSVKGESIEKSRKMKDARKT